MPVRDILYGATSDPTLVELRIFAPVDGVTGDQYGYAVSTDASGDYIAVGSPYAPVGANYNQGAVYVYYRTNGNWTQQAKLLASDGGVDDHFGVSVSINSAGNILVIGSQYATVGANAYQGAAYVFTRSGSTWTQAAKLVAADGTANNFFGTSVAINAVGDYIAVSSYGNTATYIYTGAGSTWTQQSKVTPPSVLTGNQTISLNSAGDYLVVSNSIYVRTGTTWALQQTIAAPAQSGTQFGWSTSMNYAGDYIAIGAWNAVSALSPTSIAGGAVYVYTRSGSTWSLQQKVTQIVTIAGDTFGYSVSMNNDATTMIIGATGYDPIFPPVLNAGAAYVFTRGGSTWTQQQRLQASNGAVADGFGYSCDVNNSATTFVIGAPYTDAPVADRGSVYIFG